MAAKRQRVSQAVSDAACRRIRGDRVGPCLSAIRGAGCGPAEAPLEPPQACTREALCP
jgi:hypothetical protein